MNNKIGEQVTTQKKGLELIIFDCDGVLVDSEVLSIEALHKLIIDEGGAMSKDEVIAQFQGRSMKSARDDLFTTQGVELTQTGLDAMNANLFARFRQELQPIFGVVDFIESLTLPICVASSSHPQRIEVSLSVTKLSSYFCDKMFSSTMVKTGKPAPDLFLFAANRMGSPANSTLVIEDSPAGIQAAKRAGMLSIGLTAGSHAQHSSYKKKLIEAGADWVVDSYQDVMKLVTKLSSGID